VHWFFKVWILVLLLSCWAALIGVLLHRLHGDSKLECPTTPRLNNAEAEELTASGACVRTVPFNRSTCRTSFHFPPTLVKSSGRRNA
jgi:hypothetical protein